MFYEEGEGWRCLELLEARDWRGHESMNLSRSEVYGIDEADLHGGTAGGNRNGRIGGHLEVFKGGWE